jgi:hypothetical protein
VDALSRHDSRLAAQFAAHASAGPASLEAGHIIHSAATTAAICNTFIEFPPRSSMGRVMQAC